MDGRTQPAAGGRQQAAGTRILRHWCRLLCCLLLGGCASTGSRQPAGVPTAPTPPGAQAAQPPQPPTPQQVAAAQPPRTGKLKPSTHVAMGAMMEQLAEDAERPAAERDQYRAQARQAYMKALEVDANHGPAYLALAQSYVAADEREQALEMFQKAAEVAPNDASVWGELGSYYARCKEWDGAIECLTRATQMAPATDPAAKQYAKRLGLTLARTGRAEEGYNVLARHMTPAEARYSVARMLQHLGQPEACRQQLQLALRAKPDYGPAQELLASLSGGGNAEGPGVRPVAYNEPAASAAAQPAAANPAPVARTSARPATPRLAPVILGGGKAPVAPIRVGIDGIED